MKACSRASLEMAGALDGVIPEAEEAVAGAGPAGRPRRIADSADTRALTTTSAVASGAATAGCRMAKWVGQQASSSSKRAVSGVSAWAAGPLRRLHRARSRTLNAPAASGAKSRVNAFKEG